VNFLEKQKLINQMCNHIMEAVADVYSCPDLLEYEREDCVCVALCAAIEIVNADRDMIDCMRMAIDRSEKRLANPSLI